MRNKWKILRGMEIAVMIIVVAASVYSFCNNRSAFITFSLPQSLTLLVAVGFAFHATQYLDDERRRKEQIEKIILKIQMIVEDRTFYTFNTEDDQEKVWPQNRMMCRKLGNCIDVLKKYADGKQIKEDVEYIYEQYKEYNDKISDNFMKVELLVKEEPEFRKLALNIDSKCDYIIASLYEKN